MFSLERKTAILQNRTRVEILASILNVAHNGALKTHIMYRANLSHRQLEKYLTFLTQQGMLVRDIDKDFGVAKYRVTEKGVEFLKDYDRLAVHLKTATRPLQS